MGKVYISGRMRTQRIVKRKEVEEKKRCFDYVLVIIYTKSIILFVIH